MKFLKFIFLFGILSIFSQNKKIDSLELVLENHIQKDTVYVNLLNKIAKEAYPNDNDKVLNLVEKIIYLSDSLNYLKGKAQGYYLMSKAETIQLKITKAEESANKAIDLYKSIKDNLGIAKTLTQIGVIYFYRENNEKSLEYFYKSLDVNELVGNDILLANNYNNIGLVYKNKQKPEKALEYYSKSLAIHRKLNNKKFIAIALNNIGIIYTEREEFDKALLVYKECLEISKKNKNYYLIAYSSHNLGMFYKNKKQYNRALKYFFEALKIHKKINNYAGISYAYNGIAEVYIKTKHYNKALNFLSKSEVIAVKYNLLKHKFSIDRMFSEIYQAKKEYKKALLYYKSYRKDYDSINSIEANNRFTDLETKYNFKKKELKAKEKEIELNQKIDQTNKKLNETKRQILYGLILVLFLFVVLGFVVYNARIKRLSSEYQKVVLKQKLLRSQMKPHFIFNSLSVLQGIVLHKEYDKASTYISKFSRLLREILETSKEEIINLETEIRIIENYIFLQYISHNSNCTYKINIDEKIDVKNFYIPPMIVQPIVENSFEHGFIELNKAYELSIDFKLVDKKLVCTIIDNGEGLNDSNNKNYFEKKKSVSSTIIKERLELFSKKYGEKYSFKVIDRTLNGHKGTKVILLLPYKIGYND